MLSTTDRCCPTIDPPPARMQAVTGKGYFEQSGVGVLFPVGSRIVRCNMASPGFFSTLRSVWVGIVPFPSIII